MSENDSERFDDGESELLIQKGQFWIGRNAGNVTADGGAGQKFSGPAAAAQDDGGDLE